MRSSIPGGGENVAIEGKSTPQATVQTHSPLLLPFPSPNAEVPSGFGLQQMRMLTLCNEEIIALCNEEIIALCNEEMIALIQPHQADCMVLGVLRRR